VIVLNIISLNYEMLSWSFFQTSERKFATIMRRMQSIRRIIIFNIIPRSVGVNENVFSFTTLFLRNPK